MKTLITIVAVLCLSLGCSEKNEPATEPGNNTNAQSDGLKITNNQDAYNKAAEKRANESFSAPFEIISVSRTGHIMTIEVGYGVACDGDFEVIWNGAIRESAPPQTTLFLKYDATCSDGPTIMMLEIQTLEVDLKELIEDDYLIENAIIHVANASSDQDVSCDSSVSDN